MLCGTNQWGEEKNSSTDMRLVSTHFWVLRQQISYFLNIKKMIQSFNCSHVDWYVDPIHYYLFLTHLTSIFEGKRPTCWIPSLEFNLFNIRNPIRNSMNKLIPWIISIFIKISKMCHRRVRILSGLRSWYWFHSYQN